MKSRSAKTRVMLCAALLASARIMAQRIDIGPAPGRLVDVGGRKLHLRCTGSGSPTVILEAGASAFALDWSLVQPEIARTNRVCSYDRAGSGWSDPRGEVETPARVVLDLHTALAAAGEKPPFVVLTRGQEMTPGIAENHAGLARLATNSRHTVVSEAGHEIRLFVPSAVIQAIQDVSTASGQLPPAPD
jgi:hypothetical protein